MLFPIGNTTKKPVSHYISYLLKYVVMPREQLSQKAGKTLEFWCRQERRWGWIARLSLFLSLKQSKLIWEWKQNYISEFGFVLSLCDGFKPKGIFLKVASKCNIQERHVKKTGSALYISHEEYTNISLPFYWRKLWKEWQPVNYIANLRVFSHK